MTQKIIKDGYVAMSDLTDDVNNKTSLNSLSVFLMGAGIMNDLITKDYMLPKTLKD